jgi:F0F1-type ATP synthase assembly protein I
MKTSAVHPTPTTAKSEQPPSGSSDFLTLAFDMSWKLAIVVLAPVIGGVYLDKAANTHHVFLFIGLAVAILGSIGVMWQTMQTANSLPVPKLSAEQKRKIQQQYEEDDKDA